MKFRLFVLESVCFPGKPPFSWRALPDNVTCQIGVDAYPFSCLIFDPTVLRPSAVRFPNPQIRVFLTFPENAPAWRYRGIRSVCGVHQYPSRHSGSVALKPARNRRLFRQTPAGWYPCPTGKENRKHPRTIGSKRGRLFQPCYLVGFCLLFHEIFLCFLNGPDGIQQTPVALGAVH